MTNNANNFFTHLKNVLYKKDNNLLSNNDLYKDFNIYLMNKWMSFYSTDMCIYINEFCNLYKNFDDKKEWYQYYLKIIPKMRFKKINYIKKGKKSEEVSKEAIEMLAQANEMSCREILDYIDKFNIDINEVSKAI
jgi:hypothetical protein